MIGRAFAIGCALALPMAVAAQDPSVKIEPPNLEGSRQLEPLTESAVTRDYLESWQVLATALNDNNPAALAPDFVGTAHDKLTETIQEQAKLGIHTHYGNIRHDLQIVFYSPEGLSIQLVDNVEYDEQVYDHEKLLASQPVRSRCVVVLTPSEVRWGVRIFQAETAR